MNSRDPSPHRAHHALESLIRNWHVFRYTPTGERFQKILDCRARSRGVDYYGTRNLIIASGILFVLCGALLPWFNIGCAVLLLLTGLVLIAGELESAAKYLDLLDIKRKAHTRRLLQEWKRVDLAPRLTLGAATGVLAAAVGACLRYHFL